ncbi:acetolactate decarboxylase [Larkinella rosea]|uniref:Alpha-acetolactate decarboxylase n=1 Tax=Larkinella rosea TaxID=2025312 RepID=A0A3P1C0T8_9BACT|nr:acetolactate decarboxylase [Larkinella rosea]RRB06673.1 acetolactate decarboxylase [Larkinella rosea]
MKIQFVSKALKPLSISLAIVLQSCSPKQPAETDKPPVSDFMYQYSIIDALLGGVFDGNLTLGALKTKGDFGIGTFNRVDGELIVDQGKVYKISYDGSIREVPDTDSTSIAFVKFFKADTTFTVKGTTLDQLEKQLLAVLPANEMYAIRMKGHFEKLTSRAPGPARKPYPSLKDHLAKQQYLFNLSNTDGVVAGFLLPGYIAKVNVPGFHFHYLANDHKSGGHIFDFTAAELTVEIDKIQGYTVELNTHADFDKVGLDKDRQEELKKIE